MVHPIQSSQPTWEHQDPQERDRLFELQWEISLIGTYLAVTRQNGQLGAECSKLKNDLKSGESSKIADGLNFLINMINQKMPAEKPFPPFYFSDDGETNMQAAKSYVTTFDKYMQTLRKSAHLAPLEQTSFWQEIQSLVSAVPQSSNSQEVYTKLESLIERANKLLPPTREIPPLPPSLLNGGRR